jgi:hypothetical protein
MSILDNEQNRRYLDEIKANINDIVPFLGAGMSMPYGYPSWSELITSVLNSIYSLGEMPEDIYKKIQDLIKKTCYMTATEEIQKYWPNLEDYVCEKISELKLNNNTTCLEKFMHLFPSRLYLTTNYDTILEDILQKNILQNVSGERLVVIFPTGPTTSNVGLRTSGKNPTLCYLHGRFKSQANQGKNR